MTGAVAESAEHRSGLLGNDSDPPPRPTMTAMLSPEVPADLAQHVVVVGADTTTVRLVEELVRAGERLMVVAHGPVDQQLVADIGAMGAQVLVVGRLQESDLVRAGVQRAKAAVVLGDDDVFGIRAGLMLAELAPDLRIVLEMSNPRLGSRLTELMTGCTLLSSAELAAPAFVSATTASADTQTFELADRLLTAGPRDRVGGELLVVLGNSQAVGVEAVLPEHGDIVLGTRLIGHDHRTARTGGLVGAASRVFDRRIRMVATGLITLILLGTVYFHLGGSDWLASLYLALTSSTSTGDGDVSGLPFAFKFGR